MGQILLKTLFGIALPAVIVAAAIAPRTTLAADQSSIAVGLTTQMLYEYYEQDMGPDLHKEYKAAFKWRRIRPTLRGTSADGKLGFYFHLNMVPGALELMDMNVEYTIHPQARFRVGQFKIPFTRYRIQSFKNLQFVDWAIVSRAFGAERQVGMMLHNGCEKPPKWQYEFGAFNGINSRKSHGVGLADISGEEAPNRSDLVDPAPYDQVHPALAAHLAYNHNDIVTAYDTDFAKTGFRFSLGVSGYWDSNPAAYRDFSARVAPELLMKFYGFAVMGTGYAGFNEEDGEMDQNTLALTGAVGQAGYLIGQWVELSARYAFVEATDDYWDDARERASEIIEAAVDVEAQAELESQYGGDRVKKSRETTAGINIYIMQRTLKLQNDISWIETTVPEDDAEQTYTDLRLRTQLQLAF